MKPAGGMSGAEQPGCRLASARWKAKVRKVYGIVSIRYGIDSILEKNDGLSDPARRALYRGGFI
jgi:hypothetical protein